MWKRRLPVAVVELAVLIAIAVFFWPTLRAQLQAIAILMQLSGQPVPRVLRPIAAKPLTIETLTIPSSAGPLPARLYSPTNRPNAPGIVVVPGVHYLGMDEPRLMAFARSMAGCGLRVLTPDLPGLRDYQISAASIPTIGETAQWLARKTRRPVGLMGLSFAGGLALMAAAEPRYAGDVSFVLSVGAHDDMGRVAEFYVTGADPLPDGDVERVPPNAYGPLVLEYENLEDFTRSADTAAIRAVLRAHLQENGPREKQLMDGLSEEEQKEYRNILRTDTGQQELAISASSYKHAAEMAAVSPHGHLGGLRAPVFLLHGRGDNLVPFAEAKWLALDIPHGTPVHMLVSPLVSHVGLTQKKPGLYDEWKLVHFLALVMEHAER